MRVVYPGSFDPLTYGHMDLIERAVGVFSHLRVAVVINPQKETLFSLEERVELIEKAYGEWSDISTGSFDGLLVEYVKECEANVILRGLRAISDFEYEFQMSMMNKRLAEDIETIYMMTGEDHSFVSSSTVKEVASYGGDVSSLVPGVVEKSLEQKFNP